MSATTVGALIGALLALAALLFGFWGSSSWPCSRASGALVGRIASGKLDVRGLADVFTGRRTS